MIIDTQEPAAPPEPKRCDLLLQHGSSAVSRGELAVTPTPSPTKTWRPIPHMRLLRLVEKALRDCGLAVAGQSHGLTHEGGRYFGLLEITAATGDSDYRQVAGVRNSHDMRFSAGVVAGTQVLVCDNLCFSGEIQIARKHTPRILEDLPRLAYEAVGGLSRYWNEQDKRIEAYREKDLDDRDAHDLVVRAVDNGVMANSYVPKVLREWRNPRHREFEDRNVWSLHNAFTEVFKGRLDLLPERSVRLNRLLDASAGLAR